MVVPLARILLFIVVHHTTVNADGLSSYKLNDGHEMPAIALGTSLGHLSDVSGRTSVRFARGSTSLRLSYFCREIAAFVATVFRSEGSFGLPATVIRGEHLSPQGTRVLPVNHSLARAVQWALEAGYKHIDTASLYRTEHEVGLGVRDFIRDNNTERRDLYITTKLWNDAHERVQIIPALKKSLEELEMDYVDLYLMHYPMAYHKNGSISETDYLETWQGMEEAKESGFVKSIGVSNFNLTQIQRLWDNSKIKPAVLQIEVNPTLTQSELIEWCKVHGVVVMAYTPFGGILGRKGDAPPPRSDHPVLTRMAAKYNKTVPQILLRYLLDRKLVAIPRSTNKDRIIQNINIMDFSLMPEEVDELSKFNSNYRLRTPAKWYFHPEFPFEKKNLTDSEIKYIIEHSKED